MKFSINIKKKYIEDLFYIGSLLFYVFAFLPYFSEQILRILNPTLSILIFIISLFYLKSNVYYTKLILKNNKILLAFLLLLSISVIWSINIGFSFLRVIALIGSVIFTLTLCIRRSILQINYILISTIFVTAISTYILFIVSPSLVIHYDPIHYGDWKGVFYMKNSLGRAMMLGIVSILFVFIINNKIDIKLLIFVIIYLPLLIFSASSTAVFITALMIYLFSLIFLINNLKGIKRYSLYAFTAVFILVTIVVILNIEYIITSLDRNMTLTGRTTLWISLLEHFHNERPLIGFGYSAYFSTESTLPYRGRWGAPHAHNGFLNLMLDVGYIGLILYMILFIQTVKRAILITKAYRNYIVYILILILIVIRNIPGSDLVHHHSIYWILFLIVVFKTFNSK